MNGEEQEHTVATKKLKRVWNFRDPELSKEFNQLESRSSCQTLPARNASDNLTTAIRPSIRIILNYVPIFYILNLIFTICSSFPDQTAPDFIVTGSSSEYSLLIFALPLIQASSELKRLCYASECREHDCAQYAHESSSNFDIAALRLRQRTRSSDCSSWRFELPGERVCTHTTPNVRRASFPKHRSGSIGASIHCLHRVSVRMVYSSSALELYAGILYQNLYQNRLSKAVCQSWVYQSSVYLNCYPFLRG